MSLTAIEHFHYPAYLEPLHATAEAGLTATLNHAARANDPSVSGLLARALREARAACDTPAEWRNLIDRVVRPHAFHAQALEDPFVNRCFNKPRGYAGDAVMLDFIYRHPAGAPHVARATRRGQAIHAHNITRPAPQAVRNRRDLLASEIDNICGVNTAAEILSLACGHLREAGRSQAIRDRAFGRFLALDQDVESVATVARDSGDLGIDAAEGSVRSIIARGQELGKFDFIYAAGLYDYLNDKVGARLLQSFFDMLKPGGKVWIANFTSDIEDVAFMEGVMDWWLIYRGADDMQRLLAPLPKAAIAATKIFHDSTRNIVFLEVIKRA